MRPAPAGSPKGARLITGGEGRLRVDGVLDFATVSRLFRESDVLFRDQGRLRIDLAGVEAANSAGLALLLEWMDLARARRVDLRFLNLPESLQRIASFSNLGSLLPLARD